MYYNINGESSESQVSNAEAEKHQYYTTILSRITAIEGEIYKKITKGQEVQQNIQLH